MLVRTLGIRRSHRCSRRANTSLWSGQGQLRVRHKHARTLRTCRCSLALVLVWCRHSFVLGGESGGDVIPMLGAVGLVAVLVQAESVIRWGYVFFRIIVTELILTPIACDVAIHCTIMPSVAHVPLYGKHSTFGYLCKILSFLHLVRCLAQPQADHQHRRGRVPR